MSYIQRLFVGSALVVGFSASAEFNEKLTIQFTRSTQYMLNNISRQDAAPGSVVASPSKTEPNYYYHWTRDAALVMKAVHDLSLRSKIELERQNYLSLLKDYAIFSRKTQMVQNPSGDIGEPRFNVDGSADFSPWGRPQNDGPALRAITLTALAHQLLDQGKNDFVSTHLYAPRLPASTVIKADLEYTAHQWRNSSFDVWEEVRGQHFYHRMVQRRALLDGARLAERLKDSGAAAFYRQQAKELEEKIQGHFDPNKGFILATLDRDGGIDYKSHLDMVVILAVLHGATDDTFMTAADNRVLATAEKILKAFQQIYVINHRGYPAVALGRYPEDRYNGYHTGGEGNPWFLLIHGMAELHYKASVDLRARGHITINHLNAGFLEGLNLSFNIRSLIGQRIPSSDERFQEIIRAFIRNGDRFIERSFIHMNQENGSMSEQLNRYNGSMQGAEHLTWSYASYLTAIQQRERAAVAK